MKALSLTQPWATLIALGVKKIETRSWATNYRGPVAIHASKAFPKPAWEFAVNNPRCGYYLRTNGYRLRTLPRGAIIAIAEIDMCVPTGTVFGLDIEPRAGTDEREFGNYGAGRFMWVLKNIETLPASIPCKGALGLWEVPEEAEREIYRTMED